jgi:hypothetical protein
MSDSYRIVTTKLRGMTEKAIFVDAPFGSREKEVSIPRSLIHGGDDMKFGTAFVGQEVTFRLMDWKAEALGFA